MRPPSLGRYLAPLALVAVLVTTVVVITTVNGGGGGASRPRAATRSCRRRSGAGAAPGGRHVRSGRPTRSAPGDTIEVIAQRTKITKEQIIRLNPDLDPQALQPGQKIKLR